MEGEYSGLEHEAKKGVIESLKVVFVNYVLVTNL